MERDINVVAQVKEDGSVAFKTGDGMPLQMGGGGSGGWQKLGDAELRRIDGGGQNPKRWGYVLDISGRLPVGIYAVKIELSIGENTFVAIDEVYSEGSHTDIERTYDNYAMVMDREDKFFILFDYQDPTDESVKYRSAFIAPGGESEEKPSDVPETAPIYIKQIA